MAARLALMVTVALVGCSAPMPSADEPPSAAESRFASVPPWDVSAGSPQLPAGLSRSEAIALARAAAPQSASFPVTMAQAGPGHNFGFAHRPGVPRDRWVWYILLSDLGPLSGTGSMVFLDFVDGQIYEVINLLG